MYSHHGGGVDTLKVMVSKLGSYGRLPKLLRCNEAVKRCVSLSTAKGTINIDKLSTDANFLQVW
jgi:hypothetical protein